MDNEELAYLAQVEKAAQQRITQLSGKLTNYNKNIEEHKQYIWENIYEMDSVEKAANVSILSDQENTMQQALTERNSLMRFIKSPYFGRIDFSYGEDSADLAETFYIGIRGFTDDACDILVYDWRAPVSGMFYNYDEGPASYEAPRGKIDGILRQKKQYKIEDGKLLFQIRSSLKIDDELLQSILSRSSDVKMRNIVSTIQRDQNQIIRDDKYPIMVVQGVAGSGKTSVALHRIAYILYSFRNSITSDEILIVSPNHLFSEYISNILPELGEARIKEMSFYDLARSELKAIGTVESLTSTGERIINDKDDKSAAALDFKLSAAFFAEMTKFLDSFIDNYVKFEDVTAEGLTIKSDYIKIRFSKDFFVNVPCLMRFEKIVERFADDIELSKKVRVGVRSRRILLEALKKQCLKTDDILEIYNDFLKNLSEKTGLDLGVAVRKNLKFEDALPLVYFKFELLSPTAFDGIKHVVIDEMQDYSYVHFAILKRIFHCRMTILGDMNQVLRRRESSVLEVLKSVFEDAHIIEMHKTYRSTWEITAFASRLIGLENIEIFNRHGEKPQVFSCANSAAEVECIEKICRTKNRANVENTAIICKCADEANALYEKLNGRIENLKLCVKETSNFESGVTIITPYLAKGLEFDTVIIPEVDEKNYADEVEQQILYISCTRALHQLYLLHTGELSHLVTQKAKDYYENSVDGQLLHKAR